MPMTLVENITNVTCPHCGKKMVEVSDWTLEQIKNYHLTQISLQKTRVILYRLYRTILERINLITIQYEKMDWNLTKLLNSMNLEQKRKVDELEIEKQKSMPLRKQHLREILEKKHHLRKRGDKTPSISQNSDHHIL